MNESVRRKKRAIKESDDDFVVFEQEPSKPSQIIDFSDKTARIKTYNMKEYQVVDKVLTTYDNIIWHEK